MSLLVSFIFSKIKENYVQISFVNKKLEKKWFCDKNSGKWALSEVKLFIRNICTGTLSLIQGLYSRFQICQFPGMEVTSDYILNWYPKFYNHVFLFVGSKIMGTFIKL